MTNRDFTEPGRHRRPPAHDHARGENAPDDDAASLLDQDLQRAVHPHVEHVHGPEEVAYEMDELVVLCLVRDGRPYVRSFVEHYSSMGVKHLVFLDNGSTDGTVEALKGYDNVTVLQTGLPFKSYQSTMRRYLTERFGRGRWSLYADIDELFDYPYSDVISLSSLLKYLSERSYTAVVGQMLDMFPEEPLSGRAGGPDEPLKERHRFYDISGIWRSSIKEHPRRPHDNTYASDEIEAFSRGIRWAVFGVNTPLTKHPLVFLDGRVRPVRGPHWHGNVRVADFTCVLFHYKFLDEHLRKQAAQAVREEQYVKNSASYKKYLEALEKTPSLLIKGETAREIESVDDLVEDGFLVVSEEYMSWADTEEEKRVARSVEGEPRISEARMEVQTLKARRHEQGVRGLKSRLAQERRKTRYLDEKNQNLRQKNQNLRQKNQNLKRQISGFRASGTRGLENKLNKKNQNLERQIRSIQASRTWRLVNKLGRIRDRVLGRKR